LQISIIESAKQRWVFWPMTEPGIFVEFGARNGEEHSNSYFFEKALNWTGLLVEANPVEISGIKGKRPNALVLHGGICNKNGMIDFSLTDKLSGISAQVEHHTNRFPQFAKKIVKVPCYTLNEVLEVTGFTRIDYMTVDTEGSELSILEAFDFHRYVVNIIQIETIGAEVERRVKIDKLMFSKGYKLFAALDLGQDTIDVIYKRTHEADLLKYSSVLKDGWPSNFDPKSNIKKRTD
jgi:FkbM family methyltransferase